MPISRASARYARSLDAPLGNPSHYLTMRFSAEANRLHVLSTEVISTYLLPWGSLGVHFPSLCVVFSYNSGTACRRPQLAHTARLARVFKGASGLHLQAASRISTGESRRHQVHSRKINRRPSETSRIDRSVTGRVSGKRGLGMRT